MTKPATDPATPVVAAAVSATELTNAVQTTSLQPSDEQREYVRDLERWRERSQQRDSVIGGPVDTCRD